MKTLIIVDVQNDFCSGGALAVPGGEEVVPVINAILNKMDLVVATQDWHPQDHVSFASTHGKNPGESVDSTTGSQMLWPDHCIEGSKGAEFHPELESNLMDLIIRKGTNSDIDSYSTFLENDRTTRTGLAGYLKDLGVKKIYIAGLATDYCVFFSAIDGLNEGFEVSVLTDTVRGVDIPEGNIKKSLKLMKEKGIKLITSKEV